MKCVMCEAEPLVPYPNHGGVTISRCCCDSDWVCDNCVKTRTLAEYIAKAVST